MRNGMKPAGSGWRILVHAIVAVVLSAAFIHAADSEALVWEQAEQSREAAPDEMVHFVFTATNASSRPIVITELQPSCGCTTAEAPPLPWTLAPGAHGSIRVNVDLAHKIGKLAKTVSVVSSAGRQELKISVQIVDPLSQLEQQRTRQVAARFEARRVLEADRSAIFHDARCVDCHSAGLAELRGAELFRAACGVCHLSPNRASMVPDLAEVGGKRDEAYWLRWISEGRAGSLMPAFARDRGGVLSAGQIDSLAAYCRETFPARP